MCVCVRARADVCQARSHRRTGRRPAAEWRTLAQAAGLCASDRRGSASSVSRLHFGVSERERERERAVGSASSNSNSSDQASAQLQQQSEKRAREPKSQTASEHHRLAACEIRKTTLALFCASERVVLMLAEIIIFAQHQIGRPTFSLTSTRALSQGERE